MFIGKFFPPLNHTVKDFEVNKKDENKANWLLGSNNIDTTGFDLSDPNIKDYIDGSFSTTEADKQKLAKSYMEDKLENVLAANDLIDSAKVTLDIPDDDATVVSDSLDIKDRIKNSVRSVYRHRPEYPV